MDIIEQLEQRMDAMLRKIKSLEEANQQLKLELEDVKQNREAVLRRIDGLLKRVQEEIE
jgi:cell division protein ZapB